MRTLYLFMYSLWILPMFLAFPATAGATVLGPYNGSFLADGPGLQKKVPGTDGYAAGAPFSMYCWYRPDRDATGPTLIAGIGDPTLPSARYLAINKSPGFWSGAWTKGSGLAPTSGQWHFAAATFDGKVLKLYSDGAATVEQTIELAAATPLIVLAPDKLPWSGQHFSGRIAGFTVTTDVLDSARIASLGEQRPQFDLIAYENGSKC